MATIKFRRGGGDPIANIPISGATIGEPFFNTSSNKFWIHNGTTAIWVGAEVDNGTLSTNSPTKIPTQQAVKTYVDGAVTTAQGGAVTSVEGVTGVVDLIAGSGISITAGIHPNKGITLTNTGVLSVNGQTGDVTVSAGGVTGISAGTGISISGTTGNVVITNIGALLDQTNTFLGVNNFSNQTNFNGPVELSYFGINQTSGTAGITLHSSSIQSTANTTLNLFSGSHNQRPSTINAFGSATTALNINPTGTINIGSNTKSTDVNILTTGSLVIGTGGAGFASTPTIKSNGGGAPLFLTSSALSSNGGTNPSIKITGEGDGNGQVQINGGDLYLGQKITGDPATYPVNIIFEGGSIVDGYKTTLTPEEPTANRTITLPNASGTVALTNTSIASINGVTGAAFLFGGDGITVSSVGTDPNKGITLALRTSGVVTGTTGSNSVIPIVTVDQYGRITSLSSTSGISAATVASSITTSDADLSIALLLNSSNQTAVFKTNNAVMAINPAEKALKFPGGGTLEIGTSFSVVSNEDSGGSNPRPFIIENHGPFVVRPKTTGVILGNIPTFSVSTTSVSITGGSLYLGTGGNIQFEGDNQNIHKTILGAADPTDTRTITLPNASGTVALTNTSVASIIAGTAISVNAATGDVTVTNIGVQSLAGTANQITVSGSTGAVTLSLPSIVTVPGALNVTTNLTVTGDLTVNGTTTTVNSSTLSVDDPLIQLARGNSAADSLDIGFYGLYDTGGTDKYAGLFRDASDGKFRLFRDLQDAPTTTVNISGTGYTGATLVANLEGTATTAINVTTTEASGTYYLAMASAISNSTGIVLDTTVMGLTYSTSSGILTCTQVEAIVDGGAY